MMRFTCAFLMSFLCVATTRVHAETDFYALEASIIGAELEASLPIESNDGQTLPQLNLETFSSQAFWLFVTFFFIYVFVKYMIIPKIEHTMGTRERHIRDQLDEAQALNNKAETLQQDYTVKMDEAYHTAYDKTQHARDTAERALAQEEKHQHDVFLAKRTAFASSFEAQKYRIQSELEQEAKALSKLVVLKLSGKTTPKKTVKQS